jgi:hypothetical protein
VLPGRWVINGILAAIALVALLAALRGERFQPIRNDGPVALPCCGGLVPPIVLARAQGHAPSPALYGTTMGLVIQVISIGQFIGPPTMAALVAATGDWQSGAWLTVIACALGFSTAPMLRRLDRRAGLV